MYDVFVSYEHTTKSIADNIVARLEADKIKCWYAPRDVIGDYATSIVDAVDKTKIFVLVLSEQSSKSPHVLNEVEMAYKRLVDGSITIIPFKVDQGEMSRAMEYYVKRLHWIEGNGVRLQGAIDELSRKIKQLLGIEDVVVTEVKKVRTASQYYIDQGELNRLDIQNKMLYDHQKDIYNDIIDSFDSIRLLDIGANNGKNIMMRFADCAKMQCLVGIEREQSLVDDANSHYGSDIIGFIKADLEGDFDTVLERYMRDHNIECFDIINISMVLLHLKSQAKLLKRVRKYLSPNGKIIVVDIDDGLNMAYPDTDGYFSKMYKLCEKDPTAGERSNGRQIPTALLKSGYKNICLLRSGLNTLNLDYSQKEALFDLYFPFIRYDIGMFAQENPADKALAEDYEWVNKYFDDITEQFMSNDFFFSIGFVIFTAEK